ncbi:EF-hand domain-containing protein [Pseudomonas sp. UL073]|uniref:EF-hand domain-containing protein n=1 Tax=Zestomonas insulae TaxID=2809017 RepID=A0ABS2IBD1_9GAMM|nr:EF-hand domain-containing protein [Pseudomonas insulae]MBM7060436.1 EF-hand domain-containing protein [Pseudomonas insulae]
MPPFIRLPLLLCLLGSSLTSFAADRGLLQERIQQQMQAHFKAMDSNGDGAISREEYLAQAEKQFQHLDSNGDGKVTPEEMAALRERMMERRPSGTP